MLRSRHPKAAQLAALFLALSAGSTPAGTPTENHGIRALPAPGPVVVDGRFDDWNLAGGMFICGDAEKSRTDFSYWTHVMYDASNLYLLARVRDRHPLANRGIVGSDQGFRDDCWQFRFITNYRQPNERVAHFTAWQGKNGVGCVDIAYGRDFKGGGVRNALEDGAEMAFRLDEDGKGYTQEVRLPLALIATDTAALGPGLDAVMTFELFFAPGMSVKDNFRPGVSPDRIFTFRAYDNWGTVTFVERGEVAPRPVRLADGREFPVLMRDGLPAVDWTGLVRDPLEGGFLPFAFDMPFDGHASLHIRDAEGRVVRQLISFQPVEKGRHELKWDGLSTPLAPQPGEPLPAGTYTWHGIAHPGLDLALVGWASNSGNPPWDSGKTANWGGDHGVPSDIALTSNRILLGWTGSEAGRAVVCTDYDGKVQWRHTWGGMGGAECVATDGTTVYVLSHGTTLYRLDLRTGEPMFWEGQKRADLSISELWPEASVPPPARVSGVAADHGAVYLSFGDVAFPALADGEALAVRLAGAREGLAAEIAATLPEGTRLQLADLAAGKPNAKRPSTAAIDKAVREFFRRGVDDNDSQAEALRQRLVEALPGVYGPFPDTDRIAVLDAKTGALRATLRVRLPRRLRMGTDGTVFTLSERSAVLALDPANGKVRTVVQGLRNAVGLDVAPTGELFVAVRNPDNQVLVFAPDGKLLRRIGKAGGRAPTGPWDPSGMREVLAVAVDASNRVWIAEAHNCPKRFATYDAATGAFLREFLGPAHYGASGGAIFPRDPLVMVGEGCEWRIDPTTGQSTCLGVYAREVPGFARFCEGANGKPYLLTSGERGSWVRIYERLDAGDYRLRGRIDTGRNEAQARFWADADGDQEEQPAEVRTLPYGLGLGGYLGWSLGVNTDLTLFASVHKPKAPTLPRNLPQSERDAIKAEHEARVAAMPDAVRLDPAGFTACGAPLWNLDKPVALARTGEGPLPSLDNRFVVSTLAGGRGQPDWLTGMDTATGQIDWQIPNRWSGVHGSHRAPPPENGLLRGVFGQVGCAKGPEATGHIWALNSNVGEWHLVTETGFYLSRLFQGDPLDVRWPPDATPGTLLNDIPAGAGAEDFGGTMTQTADGRVFVQAGKTAFWNAELKGLDRVVSLGSGRLPLSDADVRRAAEVRAQRLKAAEGGSVLTVPRRTVAFTGTLEEAFGVEPQRFQRQADSAVAVALAFDDEALYVGWQVRDATPWVNGADAPQYLYARGDTVDLQLGTDPAAKADRPEAVAGDLRLSIGPFKGQPTAVLYRRVSDAKAPMTFSSGVVAEYRMEYVAVQPDVRIHAVRGQGDYTVQARIPWPVLGTTAPASGKLRGDIGVTHGDPADTDTVLRTYWSNAATGLVSDEVFELQMEPRQWGELRFAD